MIPYGRQLIEEDDISAVVDVLRSERLTQGPKVEAFERALADYCGSRFAVVASNGTTALHAAYAAIGLQPGDEIITSPITFPATANAAILLGSRPIFVDVDAQTGNIDASLIEKNIAPRTRVIAPIDYTGRPADLDQINEIAHRHGLIVVEDACQALGASYNGKKIGSCSDLTIFSFHPVKTITTGEGGAILTNNEDWYRKMKMFVTHGINRERFVNYSPGSWYFEMQMLGNNYRLTDMQSALGISQLKKVDRFVSRRRELAMRYNQAFINLDGVAPPPPDGSNKISAWHLYVIRLQGSLANHRAEIFRKLSEAGVGVQVHHIPVYYHPYYQSLGYKPGLCPRAETYYESIISLPLYPSLTNTEQDYVIEVVKNCVQTK